MGVVQLNQIKTKVLETVGKLVDVSDVKSGEQDLARLTRGLTAWVITQLTELTAEDAAAAVTDGSVTTA